ncbi:DUF5677 domain-containing protein [uncultured Phascolarctobacterium sp.]|uniref:DUF5677 domain-containing protein n=1 Tax=uncultured Phascolarctobacterium sp. TaxID=512296 RepID=UPI0025895C62|nr:DUF5677 domain-containing protein [uncultured Phascolarctobacterium sp.]
MCYNFIYNYRVVFIISLENKDVLKEKWTQEALHCLELLQNTFEDIANTVHHNDSIEMYTVGNDVVAAYLAQCLDYLEAIKILYSYKKIDAALIITRSLFEIALQLGYLIKDDNLIEDKGMFIRITKIHKEIYLMEEMEKKHGPNIEKPCLSEELRQEYSDYIAKETTPQAFLEAHHYLKRKTLKFKASNWRSTTWYELYSQKQGKTLSSYRSLCKELEWYDLKDSLLYDGFYNDMSQQAHGIKASDMSFFDGKKQVFKDPDDIASGGWQLMYCITIIVNIINMLDKSILSKEIDLAVKVVDPLEEIKKHYFKSNEILIEYLK